MAFPPRRTKSIVWLYFIFCPPRCQVVFPGSLLIFLTGFQRILIRRTPGDCLRAGSVVRSHAEWATVSRDPE